MQDIHIYIKEIRGRFQVMALLPGEDLIDLGSRYDVKEALRHSLYYARLLEVPENRVYLFGQPVTEILGAGAEVLASFNKPQGRNHH